MVCKYFRLRMCSFPEPGPALGETMHSDLVQRVRRMALVFASCVLLGQAAVYAQVTVPPHPLQPSDTSSPKATLRSFIDACNELYDLAETEQTAEGFSAQVLPAAERIRDCLDLRSFPVELQATVGIEAAVHLKEVLDRIELPSDDEIPGAPDAEATAVARWQIPGTRLTIVRVEDGPRERAYLFSPETVRQASTVYSTVKQLPYRSQGFRVSAGFNDRYQALTRRQPTLIADTSSPRGTLTLFIDKVNEVFEITRSEKYVDRNDPTFLPHVVEIFRCLDLSDVPEYSRDYFASEAAVCLKEVLDRVQLPAMEDIPGPEDIQAVEAGEALARWQIPKTKITIGRMIDGPRRGEYVFTKETVQRLWRCMRT